jgi:hypothetical protein
MRRLPAILCLLAATACHRDSPNTPSGPVDQQFVLAPSQTQTVRELDLGVRFEGVTGDSRCPGDAICIQGGDAVVRVRVVPSEGSERTYELHTGDMKPVTHGDVTIALVELMPYPFGSLPPIQPNDYRATLRVTR